MSDIYSGLASYGRFQSVIGAIVTFLIFIILMAIGVSILVTNSKYKKTKATVLETSCENISGKFQCDVSVNYFVDSDEYIKILTIGNLDLEIIKNQTIDIEYRLDDPNVIRESVGWIKWVGWVLIVIGVIVLFFGTISSVLAFKYKPYAVATGVQSLVPRFRTIIT